MVTSKVCRVSLGFVSVATMSVFVACSSGDDSSPTSDGGAGWDAASNADVAVAPEGSAGDESSSTVDVVSPPDAAEEGVGGDAGQALDAPIDVATSALLMRSPMQRTRSIRRCQATTQPPAT